MKLSICLVNYHSEPAIRRFLDSVMDYRPDCLHEVLIVNNSPEQDLGHLIKDYGDWVKIHRPHGNLGFGKAQNLAVKVAQGEYVLICNPDIEVQEGSLSRLMNYADELKDFGVIGPKLNYPEGGVQESARRFPSMSDLTVKRLGLSSLFPRKMKKYLMKDKHFHGAERVDWLVGAAMLMKKKRFEELGGFDDRFFLFFEDTDLCRRVKEAGHDVWYYPEAEFFHSRERLSERGLWPFKKVFWIHMASAGKYFWKWRAQRS
jgi:GT2 family glycosyltransferase